jgi:hypothetical protein
MIRLLGRFIGYSNVRLPLSWVATESDAFFASHPEPNQVYLNSKMPLSLSEVRRSSRIARALQRVFLLAQIPASLSFSTEI